MVLGTMIKEFTGLFKGNISEDVLSRVNQVPADPRASQVIILPWQSGREVVSSDDFNRLVAAYKSWVYACVNKNSTFVANANLRLYATTPDKSKKFLIKTKSLSPKQIKRIESFPHLSPFIRKAVKIEEVLEHPFYEVMKNVNSVTNRFDLWESTEQFLELTGNAFWFVPKNALGVPAEIWNIPPQYMTIAVDRARFILGYVFKRGTYQIPFEYDEIIHFKFSSPSNQLWGTGPLAAVYETYSYDQSIRDFEHTLMNNMGRPEAVIETQQIVGPDVFSRFKEEWTQNYSGKNRVGKTIILEQGLTYKPITLSPKEMNYVIGRKMNREEIAAIFGVPMSKLTTESVNLANAEIGETQYTRDTIEPRLRRIEEKLNERLMPMYANNLFVAYDSTVPDDNKFIQSERESRLRTYMTSINEEREADGREPVDWGNVPLVSAGIGPLGSQQQDQEYSDDYLMQFTNNVVKRVREDVLKKSQ
jgi:HK97 family phage portal protein